MRDNLLLCVSKGCPKGCEWGHHVNPTGGIYLHGRAESFPDGIVFTREDGITLLKQHLDFEGFHSKDNRNPPWELLWVKFAIDRYDNKEVLKGYIYYGKERWMKPIKFKEANFTFAVNQPQYQPLPAWRGDDGTVISCWQLSRRERLKLLVTGKIWLRVLTFNKPLQPQRLDVDRPFKE